MKRVRRLCSRCKKVILDLCSGTGSWSKPYHDAGYGVINVDIKEGGDVTLIEKIDLLAPYVVGILAAPPCTMFAVSGNRWRTKEKQEGIYEQKIKEALAVADACLRLVYAYKPKFWALENPVGTLRRWLGPPVMYFQPFEYGDPYTKRTRLWGKFKIPAKNVVEPTDGSKMWKLYGGKSDRTKTLRSATPPGFARAFCEANR